MIGKISAAADVSGDIRALLEIIKDPAQYAEAIAELSDRLAVINTRAAALDERERALQVRDNDLADKARQLSEDVAEAARIRKNTDEYAARRGAELKAETERLHARDAALALRAGELAAKESELANAEAGLRMREQRAAQVGAHLAEQERELITKRNQLNADIEANKQLEVGLQRRLEQLQAIAAGRL
jgi:chromosome segregation ATPase